MQTPVRDQAAKAKTSILLHTRSRKDSLLRTLDYLDSELAVEQGHDVSTFDDATWLKQQW